MGICKKDGGGAMSIPRDDCMVRPMSTLAGGSIVFRYTVLEGGCWGVGVSVVGWAGVPFQDYKM